MDVTRQERDATEGDQNTEVRGTIYKANFAMTRSVRRRDLRRVRFSISLRIRTRRHHLLASSSEPASLLYPTTALSKDRQKLTNAQIGPV
jgi:hypothetical protein